MPAWKRLLPRWPYSKLQWAAAKDIDKKIKEGYFRDRLPFIFSVPKAGSTIFFNCVCEMHKHMGDSHPGLMNKLIDFNSEKLYQIDKRNKYVGPNASWSLRPELTMDYLFGGIIKLPSPASAETLRVLDLLGSKHIVLLRHPADYLVALYCYYARIVGSEKTPVEGQFQDLILRLENSLFSNLDDMDSTFSHLITRGYLLGSLSWMLDWLQFRNQERSMVVRYEDLISAPMETLDRVGKFLYGKPLGGPASDACHAIVSKTPHATAYAKFYPRGYTGEIGVWQKYFLPVHVDQYKNVVTKYLDLMPNADLLKKLYPDIGL